MKFSTRLSLLITAIFLVSFCIMAFLGYSTTTSMLEQRFRDELEDHAFHSMDMIERMLFERYGDMRVLRTDPVLVSKNAPPEQITERLQQYLGSYKVYSSLSLFDFNRIRLADTSGKDIGKQHGPTGYWAELRAGREMLMTVTQSATSKEIVIHFAAVVRDKQGRPFRVVTSRMPIDSMYELVEQVFQARGDNGISMVELLDRKGLILYSNYNKQGILKEQSRDWEFLKNLPGRNTGSVRHVDQCEEEITAFAREQGYRDFKGNGWMLVICTPVKIAFASAHAQGRQFGVLFAFIGLLVLSATFLASRAAVRPLKQLSAAAEEIGRGNLDVAVAVTSDDEIGRLGSTFNNMVGELKKAEVAVQERETFLSYFLDSIQDGISILDPDLRIVRTNRTMEQWMPERMPFQRKLCYEAYHQRTTPCEDCPSIATLREGTPASRIFPIVENGGVKVWLEHYTFPIFDQKRSHVIGVIEHVRDITERVQRENELRESEEKLRTVTHTAQDAIVMMDARGNVSFWNPSAERIFGYSRAEAIGKEMHTLIGPRKYYGDYKKGFAYFQETGEGPAIGKRLELEAVRKDGTVFPVELSLSAIQVKGAWCAVGVIRDIHGRKRMEEELRESERKYRSLFNALHDGIVISDLEGRILEVNRVYHERLGYQREEVLAMRPWEFDTSEHAARVPERMSEVFRNGGGLFETAHQARDGKVIPLEVSVSMIEYRGKPAMLAIARDISERKRAEEETRRRGALVNRLNKALVALAQNVRLYQGELEPAFRTITEASASALDVARVSVWYYTEGEAGIVCKDLFDQRSAAHSEGVVLMASDFPSYFDALRDEQIIAAADAVSDPRTREFSTPYLQPLGISSMLDVPLRIAGKVMGVVCHEHVGPFRIWEVEEQSFVTAIAGFTSMAIEACERKQAEAEISTLNEELEGKVEERTRQLMDAQEELIRKEKLATLGQLAGSVGHELRNPLGVMNNAVYFLQTVLADADETTKEYLGIMKSEIFGAERIVSDLLDAVRTKPPQPQAASTEDALRRSLKKCRIPDNIIVDIQAETKRPMFADPFQMEQVFVNLINNAADAMVKGGRIAILVAEAREKNTVTVKVRDEGAGIAPEHRSKLFQPLFTTKARGIGLGLVVVKNLTEANGGKIRVESEPGKGTVFAVTLPAGEA